MLCCVLEARRVPGTPACRWATRGRRWRSALALERGAVAPRCSALVALGAREAGNRKQPWHRDGRAYRPTPLELMRAHELCDAVAEIYDGANPSGTAPCLSEVAGAAISTRLAEAQAARPSAPPAYVR